MVRLVEPQVFLVAQPSIDFNQIRRYLDVVGGSVWVDRIEQSYWEGGLSDSEALIEFGGKLCYRAWEPGLNANVTKVREDNAEYLANIIRQMHGSVTEHAQFSFVFHDVSRVLTHELVRHRAGTAISQESMRYVRLTDIPLWFPEWAREDEELMDRLLAHVTEGEALQRWMANHFRLDDEGVNFAEKKAKTSFMRRFAPDGVATGMLWSANIRALRHIIQLRTDLGAEEEIRKVFSEVGAIMSSVAPSAFADFTVDLDGQWITDYRKV